MQPHQWACGNSKGEWDKILVLEPHRWYVQHL
ncbi:unnamed protein product [Spirodela intermedia]|uniref:Uncharacterized protein n=2 Tax=Spirodela intermedia TaxID=51605 RepID=A0A7I8IVC7_SPIIN|nr:unnamed protein product [Spirodela intermedia]CAA6661768.1 unnamed protein product [Spirodela intermedia]CAA7398141.1 unnamed protein product [Spirodela intermedia]